MSMREDWDEVRVVAPDHGGKNAGCDVKEGEGLCEG